MHPPRGPAPPVLLSSPQQPGDPSLHPGIPPPLPPPPGRGCRRGGCILSPPPRPGARLARGPYGPATPAAAKGQGELWGSPHPPSTRGAGGPALPLAPKPPQPRGAGTSCGTPLAGTSLGVLLPFFPSRRCPRGKERWDSVPEPLRVTSPRVPAAGTGRAKVGGRQPPLGWSPGTVSGSPVFPPAALPVTGRVPPLAGGIPASSPRVCVAPRAPAPAQLPSLSPLATKGALQCAHSPKTWFFWAQIQFFFLKLPGVPPLPRGGRQRRLQIPPLPSGRDLRSGRHVTPQPAAAVGTGLGPLEVWGRCPSPCLSSPAAWGALPAASRRLVPNKQILGCSGKTSLGCSCWPGSVRGDADPQCDFWVGGWGSAG